jgi:hypothetical protein
MSDTEEKNDSIGTDDLRKMLEDARQGSAQRQRELEEERGRRQRLERERDDLAGQAGNAAQHRFNAEVAAVEGFISAAVAEVDRAEEAYAAALEAGDHRAAAKAQRAMTEATTRHSEARNRKIWLDNNKEQITKPPEVRRDTGDKYSEFVKDITSVEREFLDAHPDFLTNPKMRTKIFSASAIAESDGLSRNSAEYIDRIKEIIGEKRAERAPVEEDDEPAAPRRERVMSDPAPGRRSTGASSDGKVVVQLTPAEREAADDLYGHPQAVVYIQDQAERYRHYDANKKKMAARQFG